ncbi:hypothetical protein BC831DRAFT_547133, partial [Entophlyctis helioformis]
MSSSLGASGRRGFQPPQALMFAAIEEADNESEPGSRQESSLELERSQPRSRHPMGKGGIHRAGFGIGSSTANTGTPVVSQSVAPEAPSRAQLVAPVPAAVAAAVPAVAKLPGPIPAITLVISPTEPSANASHAAPKQNQPVPLDTSSPPPRRPSVTFAHSVEPKVSAPSSTASDFDHSQGKDAPSDTTAAPHGRSRTSLRPSGRGSLMPPPADAFVISKTDDNNIMGQSVVALKGMRKSISINSQIAAAAMRIGGHINPHGGVPDQIDLEIGEPPPGMLAPSASVHSGISGSLSSRSLDTTRGLASSISSRSSTSRRASMLLQQRQSLRPSQDANGADMALICAAAAASAAVKAKSARNGESGMGEGSDDGSDDSLAYEPPPGFFNAATSSNNLSRSRRPSALDVMSESINAGVPNPNPFAAAFNKRGSVSVNPLGTDVERSTAFRRLSIQMAQGYRNMDKAKLEQEQRQAAKQSIRQQNRTDSFNKSWADSSTSNSAFGSRRQSSSSQGPSRRTSFVTIEEIMADREAEAQGYYLLGKPRRDSSTQTDSEIADFDTIDGIYLALRDELEITEEMMEINQRQQVRTAASEVYKRIGGQLLSMEQKYCSSISGVRQECRRQLKEALETVYNDNQRYTDWLLAEAEDKNSLSRVPLESVFDVATKHLRKKDEEIERLHYTTSRLFSVLARQSLLTEEETHLADVERLRVSDMISWYQTHIYERDEILQTLRFQISQLEVLHNEFDKSLNLSSTFDKIPISLHDTPGTGQGRRHSRTSTGSHQRDTAPVPNIDALMETMNFSEDDLFVLEMPVLKDPEEVLAEQLSAHFEETIKGLEETHAAEITALEQRKERIAAKWAVKIKSAERFKDEAGTLKVLHRQERLLKLAQTMKKPRPPMDAGTTVYITGSTLAMLQEQQKIEEEKKIQEKEASERLRIEVEQRIELESRRRMVVTHEELKKLRLRTGHSGSGDTKPDSTLMLVGKSPSAEELGSPTRSRLTSKSTSNLFDQSPNLTPSKSAFSRHTSFTQKSPSDGSSTPTMNISAVARSPGSTPKFNANGTSMQSMAKRVALGIKLTRAFTSSTPNSLSKPGTANTSSGSNGTPQRAATVSGGGDAEVLACTADDPCIVLIRPSVATRTADGITIEPARHLVIEPESMSDDGSASIQHFGSRSASSMQDDPHGGERHNMTPITDRPASGSTAHGQHQSGKGIDSTPSNTDETDMANRAATFIYNIIHHHAAITKVRQKQASHMNTLMLPLH